MPAQQKCLTAIVMTQQFKLMKMVNSINASGNTAQVVNLLLPFFPSRNWIALPNRK